MDAEAACIICNWANNVLWPYFGLGALGAGAAAAAAAGSFGGGGSRPGPNPEDQEDSADETAPDSRETRRSRSFQPDTVVTPLADALRNWTIDTFGPDSPGQTLPGTSKERFGMDYSVQQLPRGADERPIEPPAPGRGSS